MHHFINIVILYMKILASVLFSLTFQLFTDLQVGGTSNGRCAGICEQEKDFMLNTHTCFVIRIPMDVIHSSTGI